MEELDDDSKKSKKKLREMKQRIENLHNGILEQDYNRNVNQTETTIESVHEVQQMEDWRNRKSDSSEEDYWE